ncbi:flagellar motor protein MotB [Bacillus badius]|uniref:Flagellar motor rotation protein MotB n=1 Tax=Bacillus badius TaxID=1455 RepID=A0ABR5AQE9_BACBA|nr:flagellar motor protein MotB [Bacillus badius]KIL72221.1 Flagellar motor rotation protein MotB [Bacillus badius]KIL76986.1 Flagellar motor rotation protein MotB [Bacillus badius]KZR58154.1 flagellar motor protein MotB [Bacillus badius]MED4718437.1 flagellar motor protein MotB [Bacillus badius]
MSKRKKNKENDHIDESWLLPYADLLTLLLALFIVLFAMSSVDAKKFQLVSQAFNSAFQGGTGVMDFPELSPPETTSDGSANDKGLLEMKEKDKEELAKMQQKINDYIKENQLQNKVETVLNGEGLLLRIRENVLFNSGVAEIREDDKQAAREISKLLEMDLPRMVIISGHTDNIPIKTSEFESNWELSAMRAVNFMKVILENKKLDPRLFSAKGYGEYQPIASNETEAGRAKNRRVEILVLPQGEKENGQQGPAATN